MIMPAIGVLTTELEVLVVGIVMKVLMAGAVMKVMVRVVAPRGGLR
jgi:hypothetical protein